MRRDFYADLYRYVYDHSAAHGKMIGVLFRNYGAQASAVFRFGKFLQRATRAWWFIPLVWAGWLLYLPLRIYVRYGLGIRIDLSADIGPGLYIGHFGNIHLSRCRLGAHCAIGQSTHILPNGDGDGPTIGDRVWIGSHAQVLGSVSIGSGSTISAAAIVRRNVPENSLCLGNPARIIARPYDNRKLLHLD